MDKDVKIVLENGLVLYGKSFGARKDAYGDFIFNTSIVGYQEILTDPSYYQEIVVMTFPVQGIYGINNNDDESTASQPSAFVVGSFETNYSNAHAVSSLEEYFIKKQIQGISGIDTRYLTKIIRQKGSMKGAIVSAKEDEKGVINKLKNYKLSNHVETVSPKTIKFNKISKTKPLIIFYDFGAKDSIEKNFISRGYQVLRVPYNTTYDEIKKYDYKFIFLSNGPGDPSELKDVVKEVQKMIKSNEKIFGICLGHQIIALALGAQTTRLKFGHHSANHPVIDVETNKVYITSQNHNYTVIEDTLPKELVPFMHSLHDKTIEGLKHVTKKIISVQFHPESSPGPTDANEMFDLFIKHLGAKNA